MQFSILSRMLLYILLPVLLGLGVLSITADTLSRDETEYLSETEMTNLVHGQTREVNAILNQLSGSLKTLATSKLITEHLHTQEYAMISDYLQAVCKQYTLFSYMFVTTPDGTVVAHRYEDRVGRNRSRDVFFQEAIKGKEGYHLTFDEQKGKLSVYFSLPIVERGVTLGVAVAVLDMEKLAATTTDNVVMGKEGTSFIISQDFRFLTHRDRKLVGQHVNDAWVHQAFSSSGERLDYQWEDQEKQAYFARLDNGWMVFVSALDSEIYARSDSLSRVLLLLALGVAVVVGGTIVLVSWKISKGLRASATFAQSIASGNLTLEGAVKTRMAQDAKRTDEIGELSRSLQTMATNLQEAFASVEHKTREAEQATHEAREAAQEAEAASRRAEAAKREGMLQAASQLETVVEAITAASTQLSAQVEESERGASEQVARVAETATAMEEMNSTVLEVAKNAGVASEVSMNTRSKAEQGAQVVREVVQSIELVQKNSLALKEDMTELFTSAQSISQIMGVISDIADQTNLLALNAAIEAARAGEAGRGFAVVADEVRKLAEKTMTSTTEVGNAIRTIQNNTEKSVQQVEHSVQDIEKATMLAERSGIALEEIVGMVESSADQVQAIATAAEEQSATSEEINRSIITVNGIAEETSRAMGESAQAVSNLAHQAQVLNGLIEDMKRG